MSDCMFAAWSLIFDRLQTAAHRIVRPCDEETFGRARVVIAPEFLERFLDAPGAAGLEVLLIQYPKRHRLGAPPIGIGLLPRPFATRQRRATRLRQTAVFLFAQPCESAHALGGGTDLQQFDDKGFHQQGDAAVAFRPGHGQFFDAAVAVLELGDARLDDRFKLTGIQMPPLAFVPAVDVRAPGAVGGVCPYLTGFEHDFNHHALIRQRQINRFHRPGRFQSKKMFVQGGVFYGGGSQFGNPNVQALWKKSQWN